MVLAIAVMPLTALAEENFTFRAEVDRSEVLLGDEITLKIVLTYAEGQEHRIPDTIELGKLKLLDRKEHKETALGRVTKTVTVVMAGYELGEFAIPAIPVLAPSGDTGFKTEEFKVRVVGQLKEGEKGGELRDVAPPVKFYERTWLPLYILAAIGVAVGVYFLVRRWLRKRRDAAAAKRRAQEQAERLKPPHEIAREKLAALIAEDLVKKGLHRLFYFRISEIVREYVGARFAFDSLELTTTELLDALKGRYTRGLDLDEFARFCGHADLVKFAKHVPSDADVSRSVDQAYLFVEKTTPKMVEDDGTPAGK